MKHCNQLQEYVRGNAINVTNQPDATKKNSSNCYGGNSSNHWKDSWLFLFEL
jgi:hypothetical protein